MCGSEVERKKTTEVQFNNTDIISVHNYATYLLQCGRDRRCMVVKWRGRIYTTRVQFDNTSVHTYNVNYCLQCGRDR